MREGFNRHKVLPQAVQFPQNHRIPELAGKPKGLGKFLKGVGFGIGSTMQAVQQAIAGLGVDLKDGVIFERFLLQSGTSVNKRVNYRRKLKPVAIK